MKDLTLDKLQIEQINNLTKFPSIEIIWDINAFYFSTNSITYKLECVAGDPEGSINKYDEIFFCNFQALNQYIVFEEENPKMRYKIVSRDCKIINIQYLNVLELYPDKKLVPFEIDGENNFGLNKTTLGLIIETNQGFLPAFLLPSNHGFVWQPKFGFYMKPEVDRLIARNIRYCTIKNCA